MWSILPKAGAENVAAQVGQPAGRPVCAFATTDAERERIFQFRYRVSPPIVPRPEDAKRIVDDLDASARHLYAECDGELVGALRLNLGKETRWSLEHRQRFSLDRFDVFGAERVSFSSQLVVHPDWATSQVIQSLFESAYEFLRREGVIFDFSSCSPALVRHYEILGARRYTHNFVDQVTGLTVPLVLITDDVDHLNRVGSGLAKIAHGWPASTDHRDWLMREFGERASLIPGRTLSTQHFWEVFVGKLRQRSHETIPLFRGLTEDEVKLCVERCTIVKCKLGDAVVQAGDKGNELFVVLSGAVQVCGHTDQGSRGIATLEAGELFGELSFVTKKPRSAQVVAMGHTSLLVLTRESLQTFGKAEPAIANKILLNLCVLLCDRVRTSTGTLLDVMAGGMGEAE